MAEPAANLSTPETRIEAKLNVHEFRDKILDAEVNFFVLKMKDSFMLWIGGDSPSFTQLAVAMQTPYGQTPMSSSIFGDGADVTSQNLATKLTKRTGCQVFVSYNLLQKESLMIALVEERLLNEMKTKPNKF